ncbi:hypothetical protein PFISCL1PPCAC_13097, partial [Pristionchus fissidentatus]
LFAMFTARICCCSATVASRVLSVVGIFLCGWIAFSDWFGGAAIFLNVYQTVLLCLMVLACVLVFVACCTMKSVFVIPIIIIQLINVISIIWTTVVFFIDYWTILTLWDWIYYGCMYLLSFFISFFILHVHVCCYKLIIVQAHHHHHHCAA